MLFRSLRPVATSSVSKGAAGSEPSFLREGLRRAASFKSLAFLLVPHNCCAAGRSTARRSTLTGRRFPPSGLRCPHGVGRSYSTNSPAALGTPIAVAEGYGMNRIVSAVDGVVTLTPAIEQGLPRLSRTSQPPRRSIKRCATPILALQRMFLERDEILGAEDEETPPAPYFTFSRFGLKKRAAIVPPPLVPAKLVASFERATMKSRVGKSLFRVAHGWYSPRPLSDRETLAALTSIFHDGPVWGWSAPVASRLFWFLQVGATRPRVTLRCGFPGRELQVSEGHVEV